MKLNNFLKSKKIPVKLLKILYSCYSWGYSDKEKGLSLKSFEEVEEKVNIGFKERINKK
jgi:hypothetical protein